MIMLKLHHLIFFLNKELKNLKFKISTVTLTLVPTIGEKIYPEQFFQFNNVDKFYTWATSFNKGTTHFKQLPESKTLMGHDTHFFITNFYRVCKR